MSLVSSQYTIVSSLFLSLTILACSSSTDAPTPVVSPPTDAGIDTPIDASVDAAAETAADSPAPDAATRRLALFVGSDFTTQAELSVVDLDDNQRIGTLSSDDQDTTVAASLSRGFLLHRTQGKVSILDPSNPSKVKSVVDVTVPGDGSKANPYSVVVTAGERGYVIRYGQNSVPVVELTSGSILATIDLSEFVADQDGLVDSIDGVFDASKGRIYVALQRINQLEFGPAPDYVGACSATPSLLIGIDAATQQVVDINGAATGKGIELKAANPQSILWDETSRSVIVLGAGCSEVLADGGTTRNGRGVEQVKVDDRQSVWMWESHQFDRPGALVWMSPQSAVVGLDDASNARHWWLWEPGKSSLDKELLGVPSVPVTDGKGGLVGLAPSATDAGGGLDVVRYDVATGLSQVLVPAAFASPGLYAYSSAVIR